MKRFGEGRHCLFTSKQNRLQPIEDALFQLLCFDAGCIGACALFPPGRASISLSSDDGHTTTAATAPHKSGEDAFACLSFIATL
jgi:hypothetical protein